MHNALFEALGINAAYVPFSPEPQNLADAIKGFRALKIRGANVTIPYKTPVMELVDELSDISRFTCSVNTLYWKNGIVGGTLCGTTTDPYGCIRNLEEFGVNVSGKKVALLGNGGAAKAIAYTLVEKKCELTIVCRTAEKGQALANMLNMAFNDSAPQVMMVTFDDFAAITDSIDIIINATSVGMTPNVDDSPLPREELRPHRPFATSFTRPFAPSFCSWPMKWDARSLPAKACWYTRESKASASGSLKKLKTRLTTN